MTGPPRPCDRSATLGDRSTAPGDGVPGSGAIRTPSDETAAVSRPVSVLLPAVSWTDACAEVAGQLGPDDELLVICDAPDDPVAEAVDAEATDGVDLVVAGEPEGCSGKANAIAAGMERANTDLLVWTDDDFHHPPDWLDGMRDAYDRHGPVTEVPFFVGRDPLSVLVEPQYAAGGTAAVAAGTAAWGGALAVGRADLDVNGFLRDLRSTVSDDGLLGDRVDVTPVRRIRRVAVGGDVRTSLERHARYVQIVRHHDPSGIVLMAVTGVLATAFSVLAPLLAFVVLTLSYLALYAAFGVRRWTFLLAYPSTLCQIPLFAYGLARRTFVWGGRRYRWVDKFDVRVEE